MSHPSSNSSPASQEARGPRLLTVREEALQAILVEQLSYLLDHSGTCSESCPDCARLHSVKQVLLQPFQVEVYTPLKPAA